MSHIPRSWIAFGQKLSNDWLLNLSALLAFNLLMATFPFLLVLFALLGITFGLLSPSLEHLIILNIIAVFPSQTGATIVTTTANNLTRNAGWLLALGIVTSIFLGSRLFIVIENCFGIIYRVPSRDLVRQNLMAIGMVLLYIVLIPFFLLLSIVPGALLALFHPSSYYYVATSVDQIVVLVGTVVIAALMFLLIYYVVPNRPSHWHSTWPGTVLAAVLLVLYEKLFPLYTQTFLRPNNYGSIAGFALVILIFYNYLAFILLLGAEVNSWIAGKRQTAGDLQAILTEVDKQSAALTGVVPAAAHPPKPPDAELDEAPPPSPSERGAPATGQPAQGSHEVTGRGWRAISPVLRERRYGKSIIAGQIAALSLLAASIAAWVLRRRR
jgi:membrane protein